MIDADTFRVVRLPPGILTALPAAESDPRPSVPSTPGASS